MRKITLFLVFTLLFAFSVSGFALSVLYAPLESQVPSADLIVVATVTEVWKVEEQEASNEVGRATLKIDEVLKNGFSDVVGESISMSFFVSPFPDGSDLDIKIGDQRIFLLKKSSVGFSLIADSQSILVTVEKEDVNKLIAAQNITVSLKSIDRLYFNQPQEVTLTVNNGSDYDIVISSLSLNGFYNSSRLGTYVSGSVGFDVKHFNLEGKAIMPMSVATGSLHVMTSITVTVPKNSTFDITAHVTVTPTPAFEFLGEDSGLFGVANLRIGLGVQRVEKEEGQDTVQYLQYTTYYTNWQELFLGYKQ